MRDLLFEIPVYRVSIDEFAAETGRAVNRYMEAYDRKTPNSLPGSRDHHERLVSRLVTKGLDYSYNQVVGWVQVRLDGSLIKAYGYRVKVGKVHRFFQREYEYIDKLFEEWFHGESNEEIAAQLRRELVATTKRDQPFSRRYIDLEAFDSLSPYIDWRRLIGLEPEE